MRLILLALVLAAFPSYAEGGRRIAAEAEAIADRVGFVREAHDGTSATSVFVFEERHNSRVGHLQQAVSLVRLRERSGLKSIILEGYLADGPKLDVDWSNGDPARAENVAATLLVEGEISSAEFMFLAYGVTLIPGEDSSTYVSADGGFGAPCSYIFAIAAKQLEARASTGSLSESQVQRFLKLQEAAEASADEVKPFVQYVISLDPWSQKNYREGCTENAGEFTLGRQLEWIRRVESKAKQVDADIPEELRNALTNYRKFMHGRHLASDRMVAAFERYDKAGGPPTAMLIGAAHTERVVELLKKTGASFAVITPLALHNDDSRGDLTDEQYSRKLNRRSVLGNDALAGLFEKKPKPVVDTQWFKLKSELYAAIDEVATTRLAGEGSGGGEPPSQTPAFSASPPPDGRRGGLGGRASALIHIHSDTIEVVPDAPGSENRAVLFAATLKPGSSEAQKIWVKAAIDPAGERSEGIERQLLRSIQDLQKAADIESGAGARDVQGGRSEREATKLESAGGKAAKPKTVRVSRNVSAVFAAKKEDVLRKRVTRSS